VKFRFSFLFFFLLICFSTNGQILEFSHYIENTALKYPVAVTRVFDYVFVVDKIEKSVFRFDIEGNFQLKFGIEEFKLPTDIESDGFGNIYILDSHDNMIKKFDVNGVFSGVSAQGFYHPSDLSRSVDGKFIVADYGNSEVKIYSPDFKLTETIKCVDGDKKSYSPTSANINGNTLIVSNWNDGKVYIYNLKGNLLTENTDIINKNNIFGKIEGIVSDPMDRFYLLDWEKSSLHIFDKFFIHINTHKHNSVGNKNFRFPTDLKILRNEVYICDSLNKRIIVYKISTQPQPEIIIQNITEVEFPILDIGFESNFNDFDTNKLELFIGGKQVEFEPSPIDVMRVRVKFPIELTDKIIDFSGFYNYNDSLKLIFEKKARVEKNSL